MSRMTTLPPTGTTFRSPWTAPRRRDTTVIQDMRLPVIRREDIGWEGGTQGHPLHARFAFTNPETEPTDAVVLWVGVADFGAFLPHKPVRTLVVPSLAPGERRLLTAVMPGVQANGMGRVRLGSMQDDQIANHLATHMVQEQARAGYDDQTLVQRLRRLVGESMIRMVASRLEERRRDLEDALAPRGVLNVAIMSPDQEVLGERHLCQTPLIGWVKRGEENPMSFWVRQRGAGLVMEVEAIAKGWGARLEPGAFGEVQFFTGLRNISQEVRIMLWLDLMANGIFSGDFSYTDSLFWMNLL